jgi:hypothetical protein
MDVSDASYYIFNEKGNKGSQMGHTKIKKKKKKKESEEGAPYSPTWLCYTPSHPMYEFNAQKLT